MTKSQTDFRVRSGKCGTTESGAEAIGYQINDRMSMELGYRYLYTDYAQGGFLYDMSMKGAFIGTRIDF